jgi:hypothetical protein
MHLTFCSRGRKPAAALTPAHMAYVLADATMELWVGLSLKERCRWFSNRFPDAEITSYTLRKIYKLNGIKKKVISKQKTMPAPEKHKMMEQKADVLEKLEEAGSMQLPVVYVDECCFTKKDIMRKEWSNVRQHMDIRYQELLVGYRAVTAAVSAEEGFIYLEIEDHAINQDIWLSYIRELSEKMDGLPFAIYMDNLQIHKTKKSLALYDELDILPIFSITYMPEFNPIESCFSQVKRFFGQARLWALINDIPFDFNEQIMEAFDVITPALVKNCA